jgi:hypothetical protein
MKYSMLASAAVLVAVLFGGGQAVADDDRCGPVIGNWVNSAKWHCMPQGSGADPVKAKPVATPPVKECEYEGEEAEEDDSQAAIE